MNKPTCAKCGVKQTDLPVTVYTPEGQDNPVEGQRFALYDDQRAIYICSDCVEEYHRLNHLAVQYYALKNEPELLDTLMQGVEEEDLDFFTLLVPGSKL